MVKSDLEEESKDSEKLLSIAEADLEQESLGSENLLPIFKEDLSTASLDLEPINQSITLSDSSNSDSIAPLDTALATLANEDPLIASQVSPQQIAISPIFGIGGPFVYQNVTFTPFLFLVNKFAGTVQANVRADVAPNTGSVAIEIRDPYLYFDPIRVPQTQPEGFPVGIGTPEEVIGITGTRTFQFGSRARFTGGAGFYLFDYKVRVTNNQGTFPSPTTFQDAPDIAAQAVLAPV